MLAQRRNVAQHRTRPCGPALEVTKYSAVSAPEFSASGLGREGSTVTIDAELGANASDVLYALGGSSGGFALYIDKGHLAYEYNVMIIERYIARSAKVVAAGKYQIVVTTTLQSPKPMAPAEVMVQVDGPEVARTTVARTVPAAFTTAMSKKMKGAGKNSVLSLPTTTGRAGNGHGWFSVARDHRCDVSTSRTITDGAVTLSMLLTHRLLNGQIAQRSPACFWRKSSASGPMLNLTVIKQQ